jgi:16S rRNA (uracil1498-N3)-methyltransferase
MRRFFVSPGTFESELKEGVELTGEEFHHLKNVCRLEVGEQVELLDGDGRIALSIIQKIDKKSAFLDIKKVTKVPEDLNPRCDIVLSIPRFQKMDDIIPKCVELGARSLTPVVSDRSFIKNLSSDLGKKSERWNKISLESCKQSGRSRPMIIKPCCHLKDEMESKHSLKLFLYEGEGQKDIKSYLTAVPSSTESIQIFIGSEGGYSPSEVEQFKLGGMVPVTLGPLVLRVETACIAILSVIHYHFDLMNKAR